MNDKKIKCENCNDLKIIQYDFGLKPRRINDLGPSESYLKIYPCPHCSFIGKKFIEEDIENEKIKIRKEMIRAASDGYNL